MLPILPDRW